MEHILRTPGYLPHSADFTFGGITLRTRINSVVNGKHDVIGYTVSWDDVTAELKQKNEVQRLTNMVEQMPTNVFLCDRDLHITYMNPAARKTMARIEPYISVRADQMVGTNIDVFHKHPEHQRRLLADPKDPHFKLIDKKGAGEMMPRIIEQGSVLGFIADQDAGRKGVFVDFFGRPACTNKGLALIASKTGAPVIPAFIRRVDRYSHEIVIGDEVPLSATGDKEADILANTQAYTKAIEDFIRKYPDQWFWMHRRFKTRPGAGHPLPAPLPPQEWVESIQPPLS